MQHGLNMTWKNDGCPEELAEYLPGVAIMDTDDFQDNTLTGAETAHQTNVMFVQPEDTVEIVKCGFWCRLPLFGHFCRVSTQWMKISNFPVYSFTNDLLP